MEPAKYLIFFALELLLVTQRCICVRDVRLMLPTAVMSGHGAKFICLYDLQEAPLYSVKWYRGQREFYRYLPQENPPMKFIPIPGIDIDLYKSDANEVRLREIHSDLTGVFSCEVTADAPSFRTASASKNITIVEMPNLAPNVTVEKSLSDEGLSIISVNCTNFYSKPPGKLSIFLNEEPVKEKDLEKFIVPLGKFNVEVVRLNLTLTDEQLNNMNFSLRLKCVSSVFSFTRMTEVLLIEQRLRSESILAAMEESRAPNLIRGGTIWIWIALLCVLR
ncbi:uncharacterized protein LOC135941357 isoform X2 [Cloeon dipterum]|uniref:uncharacterized protein LOC135941357 isoform X2 n=1 Tax=Cloeon dipterum TaxID=197152 RepID=UPI00321F74B6